MPKEIYQDIDGEKTVTMEWEKEMVTVPVALTRGKFTSLGPDKPREKFCKAHFPFRGISHLESVPHDSDEDPCDKVKEWLKRFQNFVFTGDRLTPIKLGKRITRED